MALPFIPHCDLAPESCGCLSRVMSRTERQDLLQDAKAVNECAVVGAARNRQLPFWKFTTVKADRRLRQRPSAISATRSWIRLRRRNRLVRWL